ncbi:cephalosporin hydroxylase family protein [Rhizobium halophytocola]|uniref:Cephalosporin hydroxylase n=1 Tax=Rhizobium halophytocola TaxID=735519 RepID=A0ABS4E0P7_9HYPH|nr:cephalosporin hydroxylase family protein [Rhizobium halophytocola]MBP1851511.1 cephalosporin hydroxylase [Rhizobium halophytocola]
MDPVEEFRQFVTKNIKDIGEDRDFLALSNIWTRESVRHHYSYNFTWLGRPVIQVPQDLYAVQELIWSCRPDLVIETGIAHGGSLISSASQLALLDYCDAVENGDVLDPRAGKRKVIGVDIDIRPHNRTAIEAHPLAHKIELYQGSSVDEDVFAKVKTASEGYEKVLVFLDSNHTHEHVLAELELYAPLTTAGSYCVVWDTIVEDFPDSMSDDRPWGKGNNPKTAVWEYLRKLKDEGRTANDGAALSFEIDKVIENKLVFTAAPDGFLKRV